MAPSQVTMSKAALAKLCMGIVGTSNPELDDYKLLIATISNTEDQELALLALISAGKVFKEVMPDYTLQEEQRVLAQSAHGQLRKDTHHRLGFEGTLLAAYKLFIKTLSIIIDSDMAAFSLHSTRILGELLIKNPDFNLRNDLIKLLVKKAASKHSEVSDVAIEALCNLNTADTAGYAINSAVKILAERVKEKDAKLRPEFLAPLLCLPISKRVAGVDPLRGTTSSKTPGIKFTHKDKKKLTAHARKVLNETKRVKDEMERLDQKITSQDRLQLEISIVTSAYACFIRIIRRHSDSPMVPVALQGIAKLSYAVDVPVLREVIEEIMRIIADPQLCTHQVGFNAIAAVMAILQIKGADSALMTDLSILMKFCYKLIPDFKTNHSIIDDTMKCITSMLVRQKSSFNLQAAAAFIRRLTIAAASLPHDRALQVVFTIKNLFETYPELIDLLDYEHACLGPYNPNAEDPELANALNETAWELTILHRFYDREVAKKMNEVYNVVRAKW